MTPQEVEQIVLEALAALPIQVDNVHLHFHWHGDQDVSPPEDPDDPPDEKPATMLVEMVDNCAFFEVSTYNDAGKPIMVNSNTGKALLYELYQVMVDPLIADGGMVFYEIYRGANDDTTHEGYYIRQDKTKPYS